MESIAGEWFAGLLQPDEGQVFLSEDRVDSGDIKGSLYCCMERRRNLSAISSASCLLPSTA